MRNLRTLGALALVLTACGGDFSSGQGRSGITGSGGKGTGTGGEAAGTGGQPTASGGSTGSGGATGGTGGCAGAFNCPNIVPCPAGEEPTIPPGQCCPTGCGPSGSGGAGGSECTSAAGCAVPAICKLCADGSSSCAQGDCVNGKCTTIYPPCPTDAGAGGCTSSSQCPMSEIACHVCADGSTACPWSKCENGKCVSGIDTCPSGTGGAPGSGGASGSGGSGGNLKWFATCGPPVCQVPIPGSGGTSSGIPPCTPSETVGAECSMAGAECDTGASCTGPLTCASSDPTHGGACPISRAKYKTNIEYLDSSERAKLAEDVQSIPLVRYRYKDAPTREHLGFIIEDVEPSPGVDSQHDQVDLYGYTSMAVAALQEQHREIESLKREIRELRVELKKAHGAN